MADGRITRKALVNGGLSLVAVSMIGCLHSAGEEETGELSAALGDGGKNLKGKGDNGKDQGPGKKKEIPDFDDDGDKAADPDPPLKGGADDPAFNPANKWHPKFNVPKSHMADGRDHIYSVGSPDHEHLLLVTAADFEKLRLTGALRLTTAAASLNGSMHTEVVDISYNLG